jgi:mannose-6-phosphate isomerase
VTESTETRILYERQGALLAHVASIDPQWAAVLSRTEPIDIEAHLRANYPQYQGTPFTQEKPWGEELLLHWTPTRVHKLIKLKEGHILSYQFHRHKDEVSILLKGTAELHEGPMAQDVGLMQLTDEKEIKAKYEREVAHLVKPRVISAGTVWHNATGKIHTIKGLTDIEFYEIQTPHLDDVVRVKDNYNRTGSRP